MKRIILLSVITFLLVNGLLGQRIIESPAYEFRTTGRYSVGRIELADQYTKVWIVNQYIPGWWVLFTPENLYLENPGTGEKYHPVRAEGLEWGQQLVTPSSGIDTFLFVFPPLPHNLKTINCMEGIRHIYGISLMEEKQNSRDIRQQIEGNWLATDGSNRWAYGFYKDFVIANNCFWNYESLKKKGKGWLIRLKSGDKQCELSVMPQKDGTCRIGADKQEPMLFQSENSAMELASGEDSSMPDVFLCPEGKAHIQGYIHGYDPRAQFKSGLIYCSNIVTNESFPTVVEVMPDGRFSVDIPLDYPSINYISFDRSNLPFYAEPGDTLTLFMEWEDWLQSDRFRDREFKDYRSFRFMGSGAKENADLVKARAGMDFYKNFDFGKLVHEVSPLEFRKQALDFLQNQLQMLDSLKRLYHFSPKSVRLLEAYLKNNVAANILDFASMRKYFKEEEANEILKIPITEEYYDFLQQMPLDNPYMLAFSGAWVFFNRFEFAEPFMQCRKTMGSPKDMVEGAKILWHLSDSVYAHYFKLKPGFCYEVLKARSLANYLEYSDAAMAGELADAILQGVKDPYIRAVGKRMVEQRTVASPCSTPLPDSKGGAIFRKLIGPYRGKVIFVDFWATTCGPCRAGITGMASLREKYAGKDIVFLFITDEKSSPLGDYNNFMTNVKGEKLRIPEADYNYLQELLRFSSIPHYEIINKKGEVVNIQCMYGLSQEAIFDKLLQE